MKIALSVLRQFIALPTEAMAVRHLLDDVGIEVKRMSDEDGIEARLTLELLANRGDHHAYLGLATEVNGRTGTGVCRPAYTELEPGESPVGIRIESSRCLRYTATLLERDGDQGAALRPEHLRVLEGAELHSVSASVDATNIANLELGQPTHAFDADRIDGTITIRESVEGERAWPLFAEETIALPAGLLVIADDSKVLAIAGVIGCEDSKATDTTTRLLLESATFDPVAVRRASRALNLHTDSSARFERGADPSLPLVGAGRVARLLEEVGWRVVGTSGDVGDWRDPQRVVALDPAAAAAFLDKEIPAAEIAERLTRYGFTVSSAGGHLDVGVPPGRLWDVAHPQDLYEELAKSIGYNAFPVVQPPVDVGAELSPAEQARFRVEEVLLGHGLYEVFTDGFYARHQLERLGVTDEHPLSRHVQTLNALDRGYSLLKNNALVQAIEAVSINLRMRTDDVRCYEWTRTFHLDDGSANGVCRERALLWAVVCGNTRDPDWSGLQRPADAFLLKGMVDEIAAALGLPDLTVAPPDEGAALADFLHPNRRLSIRLGDRVVGILGEVHPAVCKRFKLGKARPCYLELDESVLCESRRPPAYRPPPVHHPIHRSLAFTLPGRVEAGAVAGCLRSAGPTWLDRVDIVDRFDHEVDGQAVRTITFALVYSHDGETQRTAEQVNEASEALIQRVAEQFGHLGVALRA